MKESRGKSMSDMEMQENKQNIKEKELVKAKGAAALLSIILGTILSVGLYVISGLSYGAGNVVAGTVLVIVSSVLITVLFVMCFGFHVINPNEAIVLTFFGNYYGTIKKPGFYYINPFCTAVNPAGKGNQAVRHTPPVESQVNIQVGVPTGSKKISTKVMTINNEKQKVNDVLGNPIIIGAVVIWKVVNPTKAVFQVDNYNTFLSTQCDSTIRNISRLYPYDVMDDGETEEKTLRGSSQEIANSMTKELQQRVVDAGLEIIEVRITHLSYSEEIAAAMLQRQQATAIIAARKKIVEGAVSMVKMAIDQLGEEDVVALDEERKAAMVSNLLVVLCGNKEAQPVINNGSIY